MAQQPLKQCPQCTGIVNVNASDCPSCGHKFRTIFNAPQNQTVLFPPQASAPLMGSYPGQVATQQDWRPPAPPLNCPRCQYPDTQKLSALVSAAQWTSVGSSVSVGGGHVFGGPNFATASTSFSSSFTATDLAQRLAPPPKPVLSSTTWCGMGCGVPMVFVGGMGLLGTMLNSQSGEASTSGDVTTGAFTCLFLLFVGAGLAWWSYREGKAAQARYDIDLDFWEDQAKKWDLLSYCQRCDTVFNPFTQQCAPAGTHHHLLS